MEIQTNPFIKGLKVIQWIIKQPQFLVQENSCYLHANGQELILGISVQDLHFEQVLRTTTESFRVALHVPSLLKLLQHMDTTVQLEVDDVQRNVRLADSVQAIRLTPMPMPLIPLYTSIEEQYLWEGVRPVLTHLHAMATLQEDEEDLSIVFTQGHAFVGNFLYMKRIPYNSPTEMVLPYTITKLLLACFSFVGEQSMYITEVQAGQQEALQLKVGNIMITTTQFSHINTLNSRVFDTVQPQHYAEFSVEQIQNAIKRVHESSTEESIRMTFTEQNQCVFTLVDEFQQSEIHLDYIGEPFSCEVDIDKQIMHRLFSKLLGAEHLTMEIDTNQELAYFFTNVEEFVISVILQ